MNNALLEEGLINLQIQVNRKEVARLLEKYSKLIVEWNKKFNITSIDDDDSITIKHFIDSLTCLKAIDENKVTSLIDIGTGGGFPGIPLKISRPDLKITLLDSSKKRVEFLNFAINELNLSNIQAFHGRAEDFGQDKRYREKYEGSVSRAVAPLNTLVEYCLPFVKIGGIFIAMKGKENINELNDGKKAIKLLCSRIEKSISFNLPFINEERNLYIIKKINKIADKYPRRPGKPSKKPL